MEPNAATEAFSIRLIAKTGARLVETGRVGKAFRALPPLLRGRLTRARLGDMDHMLHGPEAKNSAGSGGGILVGSWTRVWADMDATMPEHWHGRKMVSP